MWLILIFINLSSPLFLTDAYQSKKETLECGFKIIIKKFDFLINCI